MDRWVKAGIVALAGVFALGSFGLAQAIGGDDMRRDDSPSQIAPQNNEDDPDGDPGTNPNTNSADATAGTDPNTQSVDGTAGTDPNTNSQTGGPATDPNTQSADGTAGTDPNTNSQTGAAPAPAAPAGPAEHDFSRDLTNNTR